MGIIVGKNALINELEILLENDEIKKEILVHGIIDKEVIHSIVKMASAAESTVLFNIVIPNLSNFNMINWFRKYKNNHNHYKIRTNPKCNSQFIVIDDTFIFISGNTKEPVKVFNEETICVLEKQHTAANQQLKEIFYHHWKQGYDLHL
ncbi:MAG: hypothetical protein JJT76_06095 [Clostridiaceae bacterium]|nr:hypothetical protein [Clostridiaceae bacterium]